MYIMDELEISIIEYINELIRYWKLFLFVLGISIVFGAIAFYALPKKYVASSSIAIIPSRAGIEDNATPFNMGFLEQLTTSDQVLSDLTKLFKEEDFTSNTQNDAQLLKILQNLKSLEIDELQSAFISYLKSKIKLSSSKGYESAIIEFIVTSQNPIFSAHLANIWREAFIKNYIKIGDNNATTSYLVLKEKLKEAKRDLDDKNMELKKLYAKSKLSSKQRELELKKDKLYTLQSSLYDSTIEYNKKTKLLENYLSQQKAVTINDTWIGYLNITNIEPMPELSSEQNAQRLEIIKIKKQFNKIQKRFNDISKAHNIEFLSNQIKLSENKLKEINKIIMEIENDQPFYSDQIKEYKTILSKLPETDSTYNTLTEKLVDLQLKKSIYKKNINKYLTQRTNLQNQINTLKKKYDDINNTQQTLRKEYDLAKQQVEHLHEQYVKLSDNIIELKSELSTLKTEIDYYKKGVEKLNSETLSLEQDINEISYTEATLKKEIEQKQLSYQTLYETYEKYKNTSSQIYERIEILNRANKPLSASSYGLIIYILISAIIGLFLAFVWIIMAFIYKKTAEAI